VFEAGGSIERLGAREQLVFRVPGWHITGGEDFDAHAAKAGAYGQVRLSAGAFRVTPGVRVERVGLTDDWAASPWLQADWPASSKIALLFNAGLHHQAPEFAQVVGRRGDPNLGLERAIHVDAGIEARLNATTRTQITVYDRQEHDVADLPGQYYRVVDGVLIPQSDTTRWENRLNGSSRGVELMLQRKSPDGLSGWIAYAFSRTQYRDRVTGELFNGDFDQRHTFTVFARYRVSDRTSVNTRWRYGSNRPITGYVERIADGEYEVGAFRNAVRVPAYSRIDARADRTFRWGSRRVTLFTEVGNILNRKNYRQIPSSIDSRTGLIARPLDTMFPFVPSLGATIEF
jgi:outer membrane receptor for ferrienterochelin and colicin